MRECLLSFFVNMHEFHYSFKSLFVRLQVEISSCFSTGQVLYINFPSVRRPLNSSFKKLLRHGTISPLHCFKMEQRNKPLGPGCIQLTIGGANCMNIKSFSHLTADITEKQIESEISYYSVLQFIFVMAEYITRMSRSGENK